MISNHCHDDATDSLRVRKRSGVLIHVGIILFQSGIEKTKTVGSKGFNSPHHSETLLDSVFFCVVAERSVGHLQHFCSAYANSSGTFQSSQQIGSFGGRNKFLEVHAVVGDQVRFGCRLSVGTRFLVEICNALGQPFQRYTLGRFQRHRAFNRIFQFAHVARPIVNFQPPHRFRLDPLDLFVHGLRVAVQKCPGQAAECRPGVLAAAEDESGSR